MGLTVAILSGYLGALAAPWLHRLCRRVSGWILALVPVALAVHFGSYIEQVAAGETFRVSYAWAPSLGVALSFYLDGLSLLFALLISGIGALILVYAGGYLAGHPQLGRLYAFLLMFMASMLGLVLADNLLALFVFWELTSLSSYLLIGFDHEREKARAAALQALLVTGGGGLALLVGLLLLGQAGGSLELSTLIGHAGDLRSHPLYVPGLLLVLLGAFTKSAQFPFHFWLPSAMEAPTPVSAYLHSATMVKAGVYLLARLSPALGGTGVWLWDSDSCGSNYHADWGVAGVLPIGPQTHSGLLDDQRPGHVDVPSRTWRALGDSGGDGVPARPRPVQGRSLPRRWSSRPRIWHTRRGQVGRSAPRYARHGRGGWDSRAVDGRAAAAVGVSSPRK